MSPLDLDQNDFLADTVVTITNMMRNEYGSFFTYFEGDPLKIPRNALPAIIVENITSVSELGASLSDDFTEEIAIKVVLDKSPDMGASDDYDATERKLRLFVQGRDKTTRQYKTGTLLHTLRSNITLFNTKKQNRATVNYAITPRPGQMITSEAQISLIMVETVLVPDRK